VRVRGEPLALAWLNPSSMRSSNSRGATAAEASTNELSEAAAEVAAADWELREATSARACN